MTHAHILANLPTIAQKETTIHSLVGSPCIDPRSVPVAVHTNSPQPLISSLYPKPRPHLWECWRAFAIASITLSFQLLLQSKLHGSLA